MARNNTSKATKHFLATNCLELIAQEYWAAPPFSKAPFISQGTENEEFSQCSILGYHSVQDFLCMDDSCDFLPIS